MSRYRLTTDQADRLIAYALEHMTANGNSHTPPKPRGPYRTPPKPKKSGRRKMSATERARLSKAMSKRWADWRKAKDRET